MRAALLIVGALLLGCTPPVVPEVTPISLSLGIRAKPSCDLTPVQYATDCLAAVELLAEPASGAATQRTCVRIGEDERYANLADLITAEAPVVRLASVTGRGKVTFKVRGIHDVVLASDQKDPCDVATSSQHWLFWGESAPIDIEAAASDGGVVDVTLSIDCRDCQGGCASLGTPQCPARLPASYCVPFSAGFSCERRCDDDEECFEGAISCDLEDGRCDPAGGAAETGAMGGFCTPCRESADCDIGFSCVGAPGAQVGLCTRDCPLNRCLSGASCRRVGASLVVLTGSSQELTGADGGQGSDAGL